MSTVVRLFTLITIAAAGFALPMNCAQNAFAAEPVAIEIPAHPQIESPGHATAGDTAQTLTHRLFDKLPLDCGDNASPTVSEHPATFDTQPFVPGYLESTFQLAEESSDIFAPPPAMNPFESRAGPPDAPPPKSIG